MSTSTINDFLDFLAELDDGKVVRDLMDEKKRVVKAVRDTGLAGSLTLKLNFKADGRAILTFPQVTTKVPTKKNNGTLFYDDEDGGLSRNDPKQIRLNFKDVNPKPQKQDLKDPTAKTKEEKPAS
jgi:hypothetical protein